MFKMDCIPVDPTYDLTLSITDKEANVMTLGSRQDKKNVEEAIVKDILTYISSNFKDAGRAFSGADHNKLKQLLKSKETVNYTFQSNMANMIISQIVNTENPDNYVLQNVKNVTNTAGVRNTFGNTIVLSDKSVEGITLISSNNPELYLIKVPKDFKNDFLVHEALIGLTTINKVRRYVPNFAFCYGYGTCSSAITNGKNVTSWCESKTTHPSSFLILENVVNSMSFADFIKSNRATPDIIVKCFLQLFNALNVAKFKYGYVHHDLHGGNVLIRRFDQEIEVNMYKSNGYNLIKIGTLKSKYVPYIIDYGFNSTIIDGVRFKNYSGVIGSTNNWAYDVGRIVEYLYLTDRQGKFYPEFNYIYSLLFGNEISYGIINDVRKLIDITEQISNRTSYDNILSEMMLTYPNFVINVTKKQEIISTCDFITETHVTGKYDVDDPYSLCKTVNGINKSSMTREDKMLRLKSINGKNVYNMFKRESNKIKLKYIYWIKGYVYADGDTNNTILISDLEDQRYARLSYLYAATGKSILSEIASFKEAKECLRMYINDNDMIQQEYDELHSYSTNINERINMIIRNLKLFSFYSYEKELKDEYSMYAMKLE